MAKVKTVIPLFSMQIDEVYAQLRLMPNLQTHMYRVAGVAAEIMTHLKPEKQSSLHRIEVLTACLLHDVGNIIKFDLGRFPEFLEPEGLEHWQHVQNEFFAQYGFDEHKATVQIVRDLGVSVEVVNLIKAIDFANAPANFETDNLNQKICAYADVRVTPFGVMSLGERLQDLETRYANKYPTPDHKLKREEFARYMQKIEEQIFTQTTIRPNEITEQAVEKHFGELRGLELLTYHRSN